MEYGYYLLLIDKEYGDIFNIDCRLYIVKVKVILDFFEIYVELYFFFYLFNFVKIWLNLKNCVGFKVIVDFLWKIFMIELLYVYFFWLNLI